MAFGIIKAPMCNACMAPPEMLPQSILRLIGQVACRATLVVGVVRVIGIVVAAVVIIVVDVGYTGLNHVCG
jgi:hypothetical protein